MHCLKSTMLKWALTRIHSATLSVIIDRLSATLALPFFTCRTDAGFESDFQPETVHLKPQVGVRGAALRSSKMQRRDAPRFRFEDETDRDSLRHDRSLERSAYFSQRSASFSRTGPSSSSIATYSHSYFSQLCEYPIAIAFWTINLLKISFLSQMPLKFRGELKCSPMRHVAMTGTANITLYGVCLQKSLFAWKLGRDRHLSSMRRRYRRLVYPEIALQGRS